MKKTIIVVPTYNEAENVEQLIARIAGVLPEAHLLIVDDASPDGTADIAECSCKSFAGYRVFRRTGIRGLGNAYKDAFQQVLAEGYERVVQMDADLSHDPTYLPQMIAAAENADLVIGSRYIRGGGVRNWPVRRVLLSRYANKYVRWITGVPTADATAGFRCWTAEALRTIHIDTVASEGYFFQVETVLRASRAGLRIVETPIVFTDRVRGQSKMSTKVIGESLLMPWKLRFDHSFDTVDVTLDSNSR